MLLHILHRTAYTYDGFATDSFNEARLHPVSDDTQQCTSFNLHLTPRAHLREYLDFYGNTVHYFDITERHHDLVIEASSSVETTPLSTRPPIPEVSFATLETFPQYGLLGEFYHSSRYVPLEVELWREAQDALSSGRGDVWSDVCRLGRHVHRTFAYKPKSTGVDTLATDALRLRAGVCQDFAHVHLGLCRSLGIPARYVSGYFFNDTRRPHEIEASHAWIEAFIPNYGWAPFDATHDRLPDERYIKVAAGRDYADIRPINGTYRGAPTRSLHVEVSVRQQPASSLTPAHS